MMLIVQSLIESPRIVIGVQVVTCVYKESAETAHCRVAAIVGVVTETNAEKAIEELKAYEVC